MKTDSCEDEARRWHVVSGGWQMLGYRSLFLATLALSAASAAAAAVHLWNLQMWGVALGAAGLMATRELFGFGVQHWRFAEIEALLNSSFLADNSEMLGHVIALAEAARDARSPWERLALRRDLHRAIEEMEEADPGAASEARALVDEVLEGRW